MRSIEVKDHKSKSKKGIVIWVVILCTLIVTGYLAFRFIWPHFKPSNVQKTNDTSENNGSIKLIATGDWIAHDSINAQALQADGSYNYMPMVNDFKPVFNKADIKFCNDPILNGGKSLGITGYPKFNSPTDFVTDMGKLGCNLVNTASNHSFDFTQANIDNSVAAWQSVPNMLAVAGENQNKDQKNKIHYFTIKGVKFAFLAYATYSNQDSPPSNDYGVNLYSNEFAQSQISQAKSEGAKFIIVSMRWGTEYSTETNPEQIQQAQFLSDQGTNLILGHGSHELQPLAQIKGKSGNSTLVWYGLGNFLNAQEPAETLFNGIANMTISTSTQQITDISFLPIYMHYEWTAQQKDLDQTNSRSNLHLYLLEDAKQSMINSQQLNTTIDKQKERIQSTLNSNGLKIQLISSK